ncbi:MAG: tetratricopeptide repeat protein [Burkholderiaceae bacterium]|nr:tetratricopeptide repeat protein [Burkholderiaceae bacterium]
MSGFAARHRCLRHRSMRVAALVAALACGASVAQPAALPTTVQNSALDAALFYEVLIGEIELKSGRPGNAFGVILDAARRRGDDALYERAIEIALQARAGDQALDAAKAWRAAKPQSVAAMRYQSQILLALNRFDEVAEPMAAWLAAVPVIEQPGLIAGLPRLLQRIPEPKRTLALIDKLVAPYLDGAGTRTASRVALGRAQAAAGEPALALALARSAHADDPEAPGPVLLALDLLPGTPAAEALVTAYLARPDAEPTVRLAYVRLLTQSQRYADASTQLERLTVDRPQLPEPWLTLGALRLELKQPREAEAALLRYIELAGEPPAAAVAAANAAAAAAQVTHDDDEDDDTAEARGPGGGRDLTQAWLLLAQAAEQRGDLPAAEAWLAKVDNPQRLLEVQTRRAAMLARQGKVSEARSMIQAVPERTGDDARAKLMAEAQLLRDVKRWRDAATVLAAASARFPDDVELVYEQAMVEEKLDHLPEMERLLRRVIALKPDHAHAHNALGYSLADRGLRLGEARELIRRALELSPGDPFITDSLGWVEFRLGNRDEALRLLRQAYASRPDTEIAAHLGEVLWASGQRDEARKVWQEARGRDAGNEVLRETLARLKVGL